MIDQDDKIQKLDLSDEFLLESAEKRFDAGDYLGALTILNKRSGMYDPSADASALYGDIYEALGLYGMCADAWFRFLDTCNEADFTEGYEGLAVAFMCMGDDFQSEIYYRRAYDIDILPEEIGAMFEKEKRSLRIVHSADGPIRDPDAMKKAFDLLSLGEIGYAREVLSEISPESEDYPTASGMIALCMLLDGDKEGASEKCRGLVENYPDNITVLTTYCAILGAQNDAEGAKEVGKRLATMKTGSTEELYRVATTLCETGLDEEAYEKLEQLRDRLPYNLDALWLYAVAAYKTGRRENAVESLERLVTVYPKREVAKYSLVRLRAGEEGNGLLSSYVYRMPDDEYKAVSGFLLGVNSAKQEEAELLADVPEIEEYLRLAFDHLDGRDVKLRALAVKAAVKCRCDSFVREVLLDYTAADYLKISILHDLTLRNEENSFGVVNLALYSEFFTHELEMGPHKRKHFLNAFAEVYSQYSTLHGDNEDKLVTAAEDVNRILEDAGVADYFEDEAAISAVIYREAHLYGGKRSIGEIAKLFEANVNAVKEILNYLI